MIKELLHSLSLSWQIYVEAPVIRPELGKFLDLRCYWNFKLHSCIRPKSSVEQYTNNRTISFPFAVSLAAM